MVEPPKGPSPHRCCNPWGPPGCRSWVPNFGLPPTGRLDLCRYCPYNAPHAPLLVICANPGLGPPMVAPCWWWPHKSWQWPGQTTPWFSPPLKFATPHPAMLAPLVGKGHCVVVGSACVGGVVLGPTGLCAWGASMGEPQQCVP